MAALIARALIALGVAAGVALAICDGAATELVRSDPERAAAFAPWNARFALAAARAKVEKGAQPGDPAVVALVDRALARDATLPAAIELAALRAEAAGDKAQGARLFELSDRISRRSLGTRVWLIQRSVDAGNVDGALKDFDIALRTSAAAPPILFPVLTNAASDAALVRPIAGLLERPSDWRAMFLHYAVTERHAPPGVADVVLAVRDRAWMRAERTDQALIGELVARGAFAEARRVRNGFAAALTGLVADPTFSQASEAFPFGWDLVQSGEIEAVRGTVGGRPALTYQVLGGAGGVAATQLLTLPPGDYRLAVRTAAGDPATPFWTLTCGEPGGPQIARFDQPAQVGAEGVADFTVPAGCAGQWLALHLRRPDEATPSGAVSQVSVRRRAGPG